MQARVIPSGSMENTVLIGDHLIVSRIGYDAGIPFTVWHVPLWRNPKRQQIIVFRAPLPDEGYPDFIKRCIGVPGDRIKIVAGKVYVNGVALERAVRGPRSRRRTSSRRKIFRADVRRCSSRTCPSGAPSWRKHVVNGELVVPPERIFHDGRQPRQFERQPLLGLRAARKYYRHAGDHLYVHRRARKTFGSRGTSSERAETYLNAIIHPGEIRWNRLFRLVPDCRWPRAGGAS